MMKRFTLFLLYACATVPASALSARVGHVIDGDTFSGVVMLDGGTEISVRVRIRNVDTPEIHGDCEYERNLAARAKSHLAKILPVGSIVELTNVRDDKYLGRIDANVTDSHNNDIGEALIRAGLGRKYNGGRRDKWCR